MDLLWQRVQHHVRGLISGNFLVLKIRYVSESFTHRDDLHRIKPFLFVQNSVIFCFSISPPPLTFGCRVVGFRITRRARQPGRVRWRACTWFARQKWPPLPDLGRASRAMQVPGSGPKLQQITRGFSRNTHNVDHSLQIRNHFKGLKNHTFQKFSHPHYIIFIKIFNSLESNLDYFIVRNIFSRKKHVSNFS